MRLLTLRTLTLITCLAFASVSHAVSSDGDDICMKNDQSQMNQNVCAAEAQGKADKKLNEAYKATMSRLDASAKETLRTEQRAWIKTAEGTCKKATDDDVCNEAEEKGAPKVCGTMWDAEYFGCLKDADVKRTAQLKAMK